MERHEPVEPVSPFETHKVFFDQQREAFRERLKICLLVARQYDGTEERYRLLFAALEAFEEWQHQAFGERFQETDQPRLSEQTEALLLAHYHPRATTTIRSIGQLLRLAVERCSKRFMKELDLFLKVHAQYVDGVLLPPGTGKKVEAGEGDEPFTKKDLFTPRLRLILGALQERGIFLEDVVLWVGSPPSAAMKRRRSYVVIEIPRLQGRQILVCDQVKESVFVILEPLDPKMLVDDAETKDDLQKTYPETVKPVKWVDEASWKAQIMHLAFLEVAPGEKIDVALREDLRRQIKEGYSIQDFIDEKGKAKFNFTCQGGRSPFVIAGRRFRALTRALGLQLERNDLGGLRFLAAVYGATDPWLEPHLMRLERQTALQRYLASDSIRWRSYLQGDSVEVRVQGRTYTEHVSRPLKTRDVILRLPAEHMGAPVYGGKSLLAIAPILLPKQELEEVHNGSRTDLFTALLARAIHGDDEPLSERIHTLRVEAAVQKQLGTSPDRWAAFIKGSSVEISVQGKVTPYILPAFFPTSESFREIPLKRFRTDTKIAGVSFGTLAKDVFVKREPWLAEAVQAQDNEYLRALLMRAMYGPTPELNREITLLARERVTRKMIEQNPALMADAIQGNVFPVLVHGEMVQYQAEHVFPRVDDFIALDAKVRSKLSFGGVGLHALDIVRRLMGRDVSVAFDPGNNQADLEAFALKVYGNVKLATGEWLAERVLKQKQLQAVIDQFGSEGEKWKRFLLGEPATVEVQGQRVQIFAEERIDRTEFIAMKTGRSRKFRVAGVGLTKFANILGLSGQRLNVFSEAGLKKIAEVVFGPSS